MVDDYNRTEDWGETLSLDDDAISYVSADSDLDDNDDDDAMTDRSTRTLSNIRSDIKVKCVLACDWMISIDVLRFLLYLNLGFTSSNFSIEIWVTFDR